MTSRSNHIAEFLTGMEYGVGINPLTHIFMTFGTTGTFMQLLLDVTCPTYDLGGIDSKLLLQNDKLK